MHALPVRFRHSRPGTRIHTSSLFLSARASALAHEPPRLVRRVPSKGIGQTGASSASAKSSAPNELLQSADEVVDSETEPGDCSTLDGPASENRVRCGGDVSMLALLTFAANTPSCDRRVHLIQSGIYSILGCA